MLINYDPDEYITIYEESKGFEPFSQQYGGFSLKTRKATPEEYRINRRKRLEAEKNKLEKELAYVNRELGQLV